MNWHFIKPNKESEEVVCCFAYIAEKDCIERGDFIFHEQRKKMVFLGDFGEYYDMDKIRCWIEEEAIFNDACDAIESAGVELGVNRLSLWPNCNSRINRNTEDKES